MAQIRVERTSDGVLYVAVIFGKQVAIGHCDSGSEAVVGVCSKQFTTILRCVEFSNGGHYLVLCGDDKKGVLMNTSNAAVLSERVLPKRPSSFLFTQDNSTLLVSDKAGEVNRYRVPEMADITKPPLMLGHSSIVLDMTLLAHSNKRTFIATCDRDEKIRISHYPNGYNIQSYCLHHTSFVCCLCSIGRFPHLLLSGGGDGLVCVWDWFNGQLLSSIQLDQLKGDKNDTVVTGIRDLTLSYDGTTTTSIAVITSTYPGVFLYKLSSSGTLQKSSTGDVTLSCPPWSIDTDSRESGQLWVCLNDKSAPIKCFQCKQDQIVSVNDSLVSELNKLSITVGASGCEVNWSELRKHDYDNISTYLAKKEERINTRNREKGDIDTVSVVSTVIDEGVEDDCTPRQAKIMKLEQHET